MRIHLVSVEDGLMAVGFRQMAAFVQSIHADTEVYWVPLDVFMSTHRVLAGKRPERWDAETVRRIAERLARADLVGFSSMTMYSNETKHLIAEIRRLNPKTYIVWGGIHPIMDPEDAIQHADAICTGEGQPIFAEFLEAFQEGRDFTGTRNFWFRRNGDCADVVRNPFAPLLSSEDMERLPLPLYFGDEQIYKSGAFAPVQAMDYVDHLGVSFHTVWTIGCPWKCTYCGNTKFIENDKAYTKLRYPSVDYLIRQIRDVVTRQPHVSAITFHDDSFLALRKSVLEEFSSRWKGEIGLPFHVMGVIPAYVDREKFEMLVDAGMIRVRMGIQSGSDRILQFYERPNRPGVIRRACAVIHEFRDFMIPPDYDIIVDNPIETRQDVVDTLELVYAMPRPFTLNIFSLRVIPNTTLERQLREHSLRVDDIKASYFDQFASFANVLLYLITVWRPPRWLFERGLRFVKPRAEAQREFPTLLLLARFLKVSVRALYLLRFMDFTMITGRLGWVAYRLGMIRFWRRHFLKRYVRPERAPARAPSPTVALAEAKSG